MARGETPSPSATIRVVLAGLVLLTTSWCAWVGGRAVFAHRYAAEANDAREVLDWDEALRLYQRALAIDPEFPEPYVQIGDIYRTKAAVRSDSERGQLAQRAIEAYQQSLVRNAFQSDVLLRMGMAYELTDARDKALETYQRARALDPNNAFVHQRLGIFYRHIGDEVRATQAFEKSSQLNPDDRTALLHLQEIRPRR